MFKRICLSLLTVALLVGCVSTPVEEVQEANITYIGIVVYMDGTNKSADSAAEYDLISKENAAYTIIVEYVQGELMHVLQVPIDIRGDVLIFRLTIFTSDVRVRVTDVMPPLLPNEEAF